MNLIDFSTLNEEGREFVIFEYAVPVSTNLKNSCLHILYNLSDFFVEKVINLRENTMVKINCFDSSSDELNDYLTDISLPDFCAF